MRNCKKNQRSLAQNLKKATMSQLLLKNLKFNLKKLFLMPCKIKIIGKEKMLIFKLQGLSNKTKIFIVKGGYRGIKDALEERGWYENDNYMSPCFDFKWTCKS